MRRHAGGHDAAHFVDEPRRQHAIDALSDAPLQRVARQGELNVPRPHDAGLARLPLPPREGAPREQRHLDRAGGPLAAAAREATIQPRRPVSEPGGSERPCPGAQAVATRVIERRLAEQTLR